MKKSQSLERTVFSENLLGSNEERKEELRKKRIPFVVASISGPFIHKLEFRLDGDVRVELFKELLKLVGHLEEGLSDFFRAILYD